MVEAAHALADVLDEGAQFGTIRCLNPSKAGRTVVVRDVCAIQEQDVYIQVEC